MLYFVALFELSGRFTYFGCINRGDCLNATVMDRTRKGDVVIL